MIIGFGSTETEREKDEERAIRDHIVSLYGEREESYFDDAFVREVRDWVDERAEASRVRAASFKTADTYPDRYGSYYATVIADASHIVVLLSWLHINRRHAMSPDGWAGLSTKTTCVIDKWDDIERDRVLAA